MFCDYFKNPKTTKVKDTDEHSIYVCKLYCLLNRECRYIIVTIMKNESPVDTVEELSNLKWIVLQTRTLMDAYKNITISHGYEPVAKGPLTAVITKVDVIPAKGDSKNLGASTYKCAEIPLKVTLLHTSKNTADTYQKKGTVINALETFQTIVTFD